MIHMYACYLFSCIFAITNVDARYFVVTTIHFCFEGNTLVHWEDIKPSLLNCHGYYIWPSISSMPKDFTRIFCKQVPCKMWVILSNRSEESHYLTVASPNNGDSFDNLIIAPPISKQVTWGF